MSEISWVFYDKVTGDVVGHGSGPEEAAAAQETVQLGVLVGAPYIPGSRVVDGQVVPK